MLTLKEFKLWLDGYLHCIRERPTIEQWSILIKKINEIEPVN